MGLLIVGSANGQLAHALAQRIPTAPCLGRPTLDFDRPDTIAAALEAHRPSVLINAAAYTAVDRAETEPAAAQRANCDGPAALAAWCATHATRLIHVSTDYVFDGTKRAPYVETDPTSPTGVYGRTKLAGERAVLETLPSALILRTAWVYATNGRNFVRTMLAAARRGGPLRVVADQRGCPTNAADLADAILAILAARPDGWTDAEAGPYHATGSGETTWHGLATAALARAAQHGGQPPPPVAAISTADWPTPARRPPDSRLDCTRLHQTFGVRLPEWRASLDRAVDEILANPA